MKYILLIYGDERSWAKMSQDEMTAVYDGHRAYGAAMRAAGVMEGGSELKPVSTATSIRFSNGRPKTVDGPFAETKEQLAGFYILECRDLDEAIAWAKRIPTSCKGDSGCIEIRPVADLPQPPTPA